MKNNRKNRALFKIRMKHGKLPIGIIKVKLPKNFDKEKFIKEWKEACSKGGMFVSSGEFLPITSRMRTKEE